MSILTAATVDRRHPLHTAKGKEWRLYQAAFLGTQALLDAGVMTRHPRESQENYDRRKAAAVSYNYSRSVIEIPLFFLFKADAARDLGPVGENPLWPVFAQDCDLQGCEYPLFWRDVQRWASCLGQVGIMVAKPGDGQARSLADEKAGRLYPYLAMYLPQAILDWQWRRNAFGRPELVLVKIADEDGQVHAWTPVEWETWEKDQGGSWQLAHSGANPLGVVPFVWHVNEADGVSRDQGNSDVAEVARIDVAIMLHDSQINEIIDLAAFPMLRKPKEVASQCRSVKVFDVASLAFPA